MTRRILRPSRPVRVTRSGFRRTRRVVAATVVGLLALLPATAGGQEDFVSGSGRAEAKLFRVGPTAARLTLAPTVGLSLADYLNTLGRAEAKAADWATIGVAEPELPNNTPVVRVDSTDEDSDQGRTEDVAGGSPDGSPVEVGNLRLHARANSAPSGFSSVQMSTWGVPGLVEMDGGEARSSAGVDRTTRVATGITAFSQVRFAGGLVTLSGLRWEAIQRTDGSTDLEGSFTVQGATVSGLPLSLPAGGSDLETVLGPLNTALAPTGFQIIPPRVVDSGGLVRVTPMAFRIADSELGRQFVAPILEAIQPIRDPLTEALIEGSDGELSVGILLADILVGIASGASQFHIEIGGVAAFTEGERFDSPFLNVPVGPPAVPEVVERADVIPGTPGEPGTQGTESSADSDVGAVAAPALPATQTVPGTSGGIALAVGIVGALVGLAIAAADWRRLRIGRAAGAAA